MTQGWEIKERLDHLVDAVIDSGECGEEPTTVVDFSNGAPVVVRVAPATRPGSSRPTCASSRRPGSDPGRTLVGQRPRCDDHVGGPVPLSVVRSILQRDNARENPRDSWQRLRNDAEPARYRAVRSVVESYAADGFVLDLGCSQGILQEGLRYGRYVGVDSFADSIRLASARADERTEFTCADAMTFIPDKAGGCHRDERSALLSTESTRRGPAPCAVFEHRWSDHHLGLRTRLGDTAAASQDRRTAGPDPDRAGRLGTSRLVHRGIPTAPVMNTLPPMDARQLLSHAVLRYDGDDGPTRWQHARDILAAHPDLPQQSIHAAATLADPESITRHLGADPEAADRPGGPMASIRCYISRTGGPALTCPPPTPSSR